jgi:hypothetical protein
MVPFRALPQSGEFERRSPLAGCSFGSSGSRQASVGCPALRLEEYAAGGVTELGPVRNGETRDETLKGRLRSKLGDPAASISLGRTALARADDRVSAS